MEPIEALLADLERLGDEATREKTRELLRAVLEMHRAGLARALEIARDRGDSGLHAALAKDPLAASLLALHDLTPDPSLLAAEKLVRRREGHEACDLCGAPIADRHEHLIDTKRRGLQCACGACAVLFPARRVRPRAERLVGFEIGDAEWEALGIPIGLAFFWRSSDEKRIVATYPGPAGPTESMLPVGVELPHVAEDVEALLVNRVRPAKDYYLVSIDRAYELVGLLRREWRGFTGGAEAWSAIEAFFRAIEAPC